MTQLRILLSIGIWCFTLPSQADTNLANERQQLAGEHYETQWQVDCSKSQLLFIQWLTHTIDTIPVTLPKDLRLCGIIYNTPDNHRYRNCPDFYFMGQQLAERSKLTGQQTHCAQTPLNNSHE